MGISLLGHGGCAAIFVWWQGMAPPAPVQPTVIRTRLVQLGKKRDERLLPRIQRAPPPAAAPTAEPPPPAPVPAGPKPVVPGPAPQKTTPDKPVPKKPAPPKPTPEKPAARKPRPATQRAPAKPKPSASDILSQFRQRNERRDLESLIERAVGEASDEGSPEGAREGSDVTGRMQVEYNDRLGGRIRALYELPDTISDEERVRLEGFLFLQVGPSGALLDVRVDKTSGNVAFDNAMVAAARKAAPFPPPPIPLRGFYRSGVVFRFRP
jgi:TonB family protein